MKRVLYLLAFSIFLFNCKPEETPDPVYASDYGEGLYILTDQGLVYFDYNSPDTAKIIKENIFQEVNSHAIISPSSLNIINNDLYIVSSNTLYKTDINTLLKEVEIHGFDDAQKCENAKFNRIYVTDPASSEIKVVDFNVKDIIAHIKTGIDVNPTDIAVNWKRAFVVNSGGVDINDYDSTMVSVDIKDGVVPINEFSGNIILDKNPVAVVNDGAIIVLCKGIYDPSNPANNIESSINRVGAGSLEIINVIPLNNIYNAGILLPNNNNTKYYITSSDGVYWIDATNYSSHLVTDKKIPSVLSVNVEKYANTDTTTAYSEMIYMNDVNNTNMSAQYIYKYNLQLNQFVDSIPVNGSVIDMIIF